MIGVDTGTRCYETYPCQHDVRVWYADNTLGEVEKLTAIGIIKNYWNILVEDQKRHFGRYLEDPRFRRFLDGGRMW